MTSTVLTAPAADADWLGHQADLECELMSAGRLAGLPGLKRSASSSSFGKGTTDAASCTQQSSFFSSIRHTLHVSSNRVVDHGKRTACVASEETTSAMSTASAPSDGLEDALCGEDRRGTFTERIRRALVRMRAHPGSGPAGSGAPKRRSSLSASRTSVSPEEPLSAPPCLTPASSATDLTSLPASATGDSSSLGAFLDSSNETPASGPASSPAVSPPLSPDDSFSMQTMQQGLYSSCHYATSPPPFYTGPGVLYAPPESMLPGSTVSPDRSPPMHFGLPAGTYWPGACLPPMTSYFVAPVPPPPSPRPRPILKSVRRSGQEPSAPSVMARKTSMRRVFRFNETVLVGETYAKDEYERKGDMKINLTPTMAFLIRQELNEFKREMPVHEESRKFTHFYQ